MADIIVKLNHKGRDWYLIWSTCVDAPISYGMTLEQLHRWFEKELGELGLRSLPSRLSRVEETGTSYALGDLESLIARNHAGSEGKTLSLEEIKEVYCVEEPVLCIQNTKSDSDD